jgi:hypothetical protein
MQMQLHFCDFNTPFGNQLTWWPARKIFCWSTGLIKRRKRKNQAKETPLGPQARSYQKSSKIGKFEAEKISTQINLQAIAKNSLIFIKKFRHFLLCSINAKIVLTQAPGTAS